MFHHQQIYPSVAEVWCEINQDGPMTMSEVWEMITRDVDNTAGLYLERQYAMNESDIVDFHYDNCTPFQSFQYTLNWFIRMFIY
jgi:hypothetical protein